MKTGDGCPLLVSNMLCNIHSETLSCVSKLLKVNSLPKAAT